MTMAFGYAPQGSSGMSYCNQTPFPPCEGGVWARDYRYVQSDLLSVSVAAQCASALDGLPNLY